MQATASQMSAAIAAERLNIAQHFVRSVEVLIPDEHRSTKLRPHAPPMAHARWPDRVDTSESESGDDRPGLELANR